MSLEYEIHHELALVSAKGSGVFTDADVFNYQREVWSRPDVKGYDELVDISAVEQIEMPSMARGKQLAAVSAGMDQRTPTSKFAIVAPTGLQFAFGRMYAAWRNSDLRSTKTVGVFRTRPEALEWLELESAAERK